LIGMKGIAVVPRSTRTIVSYSMGYVFSLLKNAGGNCLKEVVVCRHPFCGLVLTK